MATLHALHHQTKELIDFITNESEDAFFECKVEQDLNGELISELRMPSDVDAVTSFSERNLYLVPDEDAGFMEFIIHRTEQSDDEFTAYAVGSYADMDIRKIITPQKYTNKNVPEFGELIFPGTGWQLGVNEFNLYKSVTVEEYEGAYAFVRRVATAFGAELRFRVETSGSRVTGRFVDFLIKEGEDTKKEIELGKDLLGVRVEMDGQNIVTELLCIGPERDTGGRFTASVTNEAAFQRWNIDNTHLTRVYYPESDDAGMTREQLIGYGTKELNKRIASVYTYEVTAAVIENEFPHEKTRIGDRVRVKNADFKPPLYADARIIRIVRYIGEVDRKEYVIGEVQTYKESEILRRARMYSKMYASKVLRQPTEPPGNANHIWIKTGGPVEIPHTWNGIAWQKASPTEAIEIGATTPADVIAEVGQQIDAVEIGTRNLFIARNMLADTYIGSDGALKPNVGSFTSDKISVLRMEDITGQTNGRNKYKQFAFYTAADVFIPPLVEYNQPNMDYITAKVPANAAYARFSSDDYADSFFKVERGTKATDWTPSPEDAEFKAAAEAARLAKAAEDAAKLHADNELKKNSQANQSFILDYAQTKITQAPTAPTTPGIGNLWIDTSTGKPVWKRWNGTIWELAAMTTLAQLSGYLQDGQITDQFIKSRHIATQSITSEMVVAAGLDAAVIKFGTMSGERIAANSISADKIAATTLSAITANLGNVTAGKIDGVTFTSGIGSGTEYELKDGYARFTNKETVGTNKYLREVVLSNGALDARTELNNAKFATVRLTAETFSMAAEERQAMMFIQPDLIEFIAGASNVISVAKNKMYIVPGINYGTIQDNKELRLMGGPSTLVIKDNALRYNGVTIGLSGSRRLWAGAKWMTDAADQPVFPTRRLSDCPSGWLLVWSRFVNGAAADTDWNHTFIPKEQVEFTTNGMWADLIATGADGTRIRAGKYIYPKDDRILGHASNGTGSESGQVLRYVLAV